MPTSRKQTPRQVQRAAAELGEYLSTWRKLQGLTQHQLAARAGIARGTVSRLESGSGEINLESALRILRALGLLDRALEALDPFESDVGRLRSEERLPQRVRPRSLKDGS